MNRVYRTPTHIIEIEVVGDQTAASVRAMGIEAARLAAQLRREQRPVLVLDNLKRLGHTDSAARREVARIARQLDFDRGAMLGDATPLMRLGTNLMLRAIGRPNLRYFASRDAALLWLTTDQPAQPGPEQDNAPVSS